MSSDFDYASHWWLYPEVNAYVAEGFAGQIIAVLPDHDLVVVFTGNVDWPWPFNFYLKDFIIPAIETGSISPELYITLIMGGILIIHVLLRKKR